MSFKLRVTEAGEVTDRTFTYEEGRLKGQQGISHDQWCSGIVQESLLDSPQDNWELRVKIGKADRQKMQVGDLVEIKDAKGYVKNKDGTPRTNPFWMVKDWRLVDRQGGLPGLVPGQPRQAPQAAPGAPKMELDVWLGYGFMAASEGLRWAKDKAPDAGGAAHLGFAQSTMATALIQLAREYGVQASTPVGYVPSKVEAEEDGSIPF